ncbi:MAG: flippase-like domain-containing protein [Spirulina sp. SIO3F2]|nr:flippase-like domain-containing protein [Spirulina sp. SIO3F2]
MKSKLFFILKIIVSLGLLALIFFHVDIDRAWRQFQTLRLSFLGFALLYYTGLQWLSCLRWQIILRSANHLVPMSSLLSSYFAGMFLNFFLPSSLGGDVYRIYRIANATQDSETAVVSVFLERFTGLAALSALAVLGLPPVFKVVGRWDIVILFLGCVAALVGGVLLIVSPRLLIWAEPWLQKLRLNSLAARLAKIQLLLRQFAQHRQALLKSIGLSFLLQLGIVYYHYWVAQNLSIFISFWNLLVFIPIISVVTLIPISLGGLGLKEGLWVYLLGRVALSSEQALLLSLTITLLAWLLSLPGGVILLLDLAGFQQGRQEKLKG